jgi:hypothetical protein
MRNERRSLIILFFYVIVMLLMCLFTVSVIQKEATGTNTPIYDDTTGKDTSNTVYVPVYVGSAPIESDTTIPDTTEPETSYTVKSYKGKIGIFKSNGDLIQILDVYTITLPIADREMLEEGIDIDNVDELRDIIEDYTG